MLGNYFLPVVSTAEGALIRDERIDSLSVIGALVVIAGAWLTSRRGAPSQSPPAAAMGITSPVAAAPESVHDGMLRADSAMVSMTEMSKSKG